MIRDAETELTMRISAIRSFNRFYTRQLGLLREGMHQSRFSLAEARVIYELAKGSPLTAAAVSGALDLDPGYLSRILGKLIDQDLVIKQPSASDRRQQQLRLTGRGYEEFARLDSGSHDQVAQMLADLEIGEQERLIGAMRAIEGLLAAPTEKPPYVLRPHRPGDMGWIVARHAVLYAQERGWDSTFEALVAEIVAEFLRHFDQARERCWVAEIDGEPVGCVFVVKATEEIAKLRLLLVDRKARGLGIGGRLVEECVRFARQSGYKTMTLWTQSILTPARRIYEGAGFQRVSEERHTSFGQDLVGETWELTL
jgi:DNA-binding MarR family transcriptional regulator/GNAT superfamily N-acetyltransferase